MSEMEQERSTVSICGYFI